MTRRQRRDYWDKFVCVYIYCPETWCKLQTPSYQCVVLRHVTKQDTRMQHNIEKPSRNHCCGGKSKTFKFLITYLLPYLFSMQSARTMLYFYLRPAWLHLIISRDIINGIKIYIYIVYIIYVLIFCTILHEIFFIL